MRRLSTIVRAAALAASIVACAWPSVARAHAFPSSEVPKVGSTVNSPPPAVAITFDNPIEALFAKLQVLDSNGQDEAAAPPKVDADHRRLSVPLKPLKPGDYTVKWNVVAEDGHRTEGSFQFTVAGDSR